MRTARLALLGVLLLPLGCLSAQDPAPPPEPREPVADTAVEPEAVTGTDAPSEPGWAADPDAVAVLMDPAGDSAGVAELIETPRNGVLLRVRAEGLRVGAHALHIHETGACDAPTFESAGGHFAPRERSHGALHPEGMHAGDLPNLVASEQGPVRAERFAPDVTLAEGEPGSLFDEDGSAVVIHQGPDDYVSQPSGDAGDRLLCGVVRR